MIKKQQLSKCKVQRDSQKQIHSFRSFVGTNKSAAEYAQLKTFRKNATDSVNKVKLFFPKVIKLKLSTQSSESIFFSIKSNIQF